ncbi:MAG TPA: sigma-70 family RNA polymerase sigma factor [Flavisolibacter sp.]|nr:sigma-70 family RNA polymerase sigma factor [Flavisolibacter sp.]
MSYKHLTDAVLVDRLTQSDERAFEEIYLRYWQRVFRIAFGRIGEQVVVEDICHEVFLSLWQRRIQLQINNLEAYLTQAAKYAVINVYKASVRDETHLAKYAQTLSNTHSDAEDSVFLNSLQQAWVTALDALPGKTKAVFQFSRIDHLSNREIAEKLELTEKAVEYHITKALKHLKVSLKDFFVFLPFLLEMLF